MKNLTLTKKKIKAEWITASSFRPYGQLILPADHGKIFDQQDAQLDLSQGVPRFYIMQLEKRGRTFHLITHHRKCTQCLGSLGNKDWYMVVAPPNNQEIPDLEMMQAFRIPSDCFIKLEAGTWHAGPYFDHDVVNFYNLELSHTNVEDHWTYDFRKELQIEWIIE